MAEKAQAAKGPAAAKRSAKAGPKVAAKPSAAGPDSATSGAAKAGTLAKAVARRAAKAAPKRLYTADEIAESFRRLAVQRPDPKPELEHADAFTLLVAVVLSAQATDLGVNRATRILFALASTPAAMAALGVERIEEAIRSLGLYRNKAKNVAALAKTIAEVHGGEVPSSRQALEALPGVGRKTANVVLNAAFGEETLAVDTHIFRIGNRLKIAPGPTPEAVERAFLEIIPPEHLRNAHHWILLHGRYVCKARKPDCGICVIADLCKADERWNAIPAPLIPLPLMPSGLQGAPEVRVAG